MYSTCTRSSNLTWAFSCTLCEHQKSSVLTGLPVLVRRKPVVLQEIRRRRSVPRIQLHDLADEVPVLRRELWIFGHRERFRLFVLPDVLHRRRHDRQSLLIGDVRVRSRHGPEVMELVDQHLHGVRSVVWFDIVRLEDMPVLAPDEAYELRCGTVSMPPMHSVMGGNGVSTHRGAKGPDVGGGSPSQIEHSFGTAEDGRPDDVTLLSGICIGFHAGDGAAVAQLDFAEPRRPIAVADEDIVGFDV